MNMLRTSKIVFAVVIGFFLVVPVLAILPLAFTDSASLQYPIEKYSMRWFIVLATDSKWRQAIMNSVFISVSVTVLSIILGTLGALGLRGRLSSRFFSTIRTMFLLPMVVPAVILGFGLLRTFPQYGLADTYIGVIAAHTVIAVPFVVVNVLASLQGIDPRLENAAASLGASPPVVLGLITLPLALPGILSGAVFAFATSFDEVVLSMFVAGPNQWVLGRQMFSSIRENISPAIAAAAFMFVVCTIVLAGLALLVTNRSKVAAPH